MSKVVFRHTDLKVIKLLLKELGKERYDCALKDSGLSQSKPITMHGFFIEWDEGNIDLHYTYPSGRSFKLMTVLGMQRIPFEGWELVRKL
ncbi:hypothetical protein [Zobellia galactanivorans]|uniref:Uncharacterized protein n=1 Tax=Zobellia galactanivorans (strain DSM 12802 / CCUG 47099 / CIP 106680 / NCIMB 13871 / Dsij) TaxID=63186 RepID=G0L6C8_ZOBGA|nr:hypothetical protein [Zobellia galactanivorans]CAZ96850.1 Conserved hypothetical protein [Zobellia galactanivorans]